MSTRRPYRYGCASNSITTNVGQRRANFIASGMDKRSHPGWFAMLDLVEIVRNQKGGDASSAAAAKILVRELGESAPAPTEA